MKLFAKIILNLILLFCFSLNHAHAQKKTKEEVERRNKEVKAFQDLITAEQLSISKNLKTKKPCNEKARYAIKSAQFNLEGKLIRKSLDRFHNHYYPKNKAFDNAKPNSFPSNVDFALSILMDLSTTKYRNDREKVLNEFIKMFSRKSKNELSSNEYSTFRSYVNNVLFMRPGYTFYKEIIRKRATKCTHYMECTLKQKLIKYPSFEWEFGIFYNKNCACSTKSTKKDLKKVVVHFTGTLKTVFTSNGFNIVSLTKKKQENRVICCNEPKKKVEDPKGALDPYKENSFLPGYDQDSVNQQVGYDPFSIIGGGLGLGFNDNFNEVGLGLSAEYLHQVKLAKGVDNLLWYVGGDFELSALFSDFNKSRGVKVGPKIQLHKRLPQVGLLQWINGLKAQYMSIRNEWNGFGSNVSGANIGLFTGLNFPISTKVNLGIEVPVLNFTSTTTKPDVGQESSASNISLLMNQNNLARVLLRVPLGN